MTRLIDNRPKRLFGLICEIGEGEEWPRGHGFAYRRWNTFGCVTALFPLNYMLGAARTIWLEARYRWVPKSRIDRDFAMRFDQVRREGDLSGWDAGFKSGYKNGWNDALEHMVAQARDESDRSARAAEERARQENP